MSWAASMWHVLRAKATDAGLIGRLGSPDTLLGLDGSVLLSFAESVLYDGDNAEALDKLYRDSAPKPKQSRDNRNAEIARVINLFS